MTSAATIPHRRHRMHERALSEHQPAERPAADFDVAVVGGRCAGASLAIRLARGGWRVALIDRDDFPSDTVSTHVMFPDSLAQLDELGVLDRLRAEHRLAPVQFSWRVLGREVAGSFSPVGGHDHCLSIRRVTLDAALIRTAADAGVSLLLGRRVTGVIGGGTVSDPARGVILDDGSHVTARWVAAADGRNSTVARRLALTTEEERSGDMAFLLAYWAGLPTAHWCRIDMHLDAGVMSVPVEDGLHLISVTGPRELTRGTPEELQRRYTAAVRRFPAVLNPRLLDSATQVGPVTAVPETMMRGYSRAASGPGWFTVGDAGHLKHPSTAQGIGDALAHTKYVAEQLLNGGDLAGYGRWRDERAADHAEWSFRAARFPTPDAESLYAGIAADPDARQDFLDTFTKRRRMADVLTPQRVQRWRAAAAYEDGLRRLDALLAEVPPAQLTSVVPACPAWTIRDLLAHVAGVATDAGRGAYYAGALDAWHDPDRAAGRERWTANHVDARRHDNVESLLSELHRHGNDLVQALRQGTGIVKGMPEWMILAPVGDLAVHLDDLLETLHAPAHVSSLVTRTGFALYRDWLAGRIARLSLPALELTDGQRQWTVGHGDPVATLHGDRHELFRVIAGRRSSADILAMKWVGDPTRHLPIIAPYPISG
ncbi:FAD-dependent monooxygenase [Nakamurella sp. GG22]